MLILSSGGLNTSARDARTLPARSAGFASQFRQGNAMNKKNTKTKELISEFRFFYFPDKPNALSLPCLQYGIDCGEGWFDLLYKLCKSIQVVLDKSPDFKKTFYVTRIKQKFAGLRFYTQGRHKEIDKLISKAEDQSFKTCERCGKKGKLRGGAWVFTLCDKCNKKRKPILP
jgi:hypothetical protein